MIEILRVLMHGAQHPHQVAQSVNNILGGGAGLHHFRTPATERDDPDPRTDVERYVTPSAFDLRLVADHLVASARSAPIDQSEIDSLLSATKAVMNDEIVPPVPFYLAPLLKVYESDRPVSLHNVAQSFHAAQWAKEWRIRVLGQNRYDKAHCLVDEVLARIAAEMKDHPAQEYEPSTTQLLSAVEALAKSVRRSTYMRDHLIHRANVVHHVSLRDLGVLTKMSYSTVRNVKDRITTPMSLEMVDELVSYLPSEASGN